jgi:hypothetical protein
MRDMADPNWLPGDETFSLTAPDGAVLPVYA